eukprot:353414-Chlamydomonas_euryale.AAC.3
MPLLQRFPLLRPPPQPPVYAPPRCLPSSFDRPSADRHPALRHTSADPLLTIAPPSVTPRPTLC